MNPRAALTRDLKTRGCLSICRVATFLFKPVAPEADHLRPIPSSTSNMPKCLHKKLEQRTCKWNNAVPWSLMTGA